MRRVAFAVFATCVLAVAASLAGAAHAGDYYRYDDDGYRVRPSYRSASVWYSSSCCYRKIVRHERTVRYVPIERHRYVDRAYRYGSYDQPRHYRHYAPAYRTSRWIESVYSDNAVDVCYPRRVRVLDGRGGWIWGVRAVCD
jgi:hypothetical protein